MPFFGGSKRSSANVKGSRAREEARLPGGRAAGKGGREREREREREGRLLAVCMKLVRRAGKLALVNVIGACRRRNKNGELII